MKRLRGFLSRLVLSEDIDPEARGRVLLLGGITTVIVAAIVLVAVGYYVDRIAPRGDTVLRVGNRDFSYAYVENRLDSDIATGIFPTQNIQAGISATLSRIQQEELLRLIADDRGLTVSDKEIDATIRDELGLNEDTDQNRLASALRNQLLTLGLSLDRYREIIVADVVEQKLREELAVEVPEEGEQVDLRLIQVGSEAEALTAQERLENGEDFDVVAVEASGHESAAEGGALGWTPRGLLPEDLDEAAFSTEGRTDIIENDRGFFILEVLAKETRPIDEAQKDSLVRERLIRMLSEAETTYGVENLLTVGQLRDLASHIGAPLG